MPVHGARFGRAFENLKVGTKIGFVSGAVLVILGALSVQSVDSLAKIGDAFQDYAGTVRIVDTARTIDRDMSEVRRLVREYAVTGQGDHAEAARAAMGRLRAGLDHGLTLVSDPDLRGDLTESRGKADAYTRSFDDIVAWKTEADRLVREVLDPTGNAVMEALEEARLVAVKDGNSDAVTLTGSALETLLKAELAANRMLARHDKASAASAADRLAGLERVLAVLSSASAGRSYGNTVARTRDLAAEYRRSFDRVVELSGAIEHRINGPMLEMGNMLTATAAHVRDTAAEEELRVETETVDSVSVTKRLIVALSCAGFLLGAALAWASGRAISRPIVRMTDVMRRLAEGDREVDIPGVGRRDEIGSMAEAVDVFKRNAITAHRLAEEQKAEQAGKEARAAEIVRLVGAFDSSVSSILRTVSSAATELDGTAQSMAAIAEETDRQATASAAAAEQTSNNVQTVASAAEEMSGSLQEIARQVTRSNTVANQAVEQAAQKLGAAWERTYRSAIDLARTAGQDTVELEREAVQERISIYQQIEQAYRETIDRLIAEERRHLDAARRAEEERLNLKLSVEDRIREIARKGMDEYAAYQDRLRQIDEKQAAARQALAAGDFERAKRLADEAISLAERSANEVTRRVDQNGKTVTQTVVSQAQASARAIAEIRESARIADQALAALGNAHRSAATQAGSAADAVKRQLESVRKEIETLRSGLIGKEEVQLKVKADGVDEIARKLRELADAKEIITRVKADTEDAKRALEALQKDADNRELVFKAKLASDQVAADIENLKTTLARNGIQVPAQFDEALAALRSFSDTVRSELSTPTQHTHTPVVDLSQYYAARRELEQTTSSEHIIYVRKVETNAIGGLVGRFAAGGQALGMRFRRLVGRIIGPGTSTSDSIPAMLSNGEFVIRASSVRKFGVEFFEALNAGRLPALLGLAASPVRVPQIAIQNATERGAGDAQLRILLESPGRQPVRLISERDKVRELVEMLRAAGLTVQAKPV